MAATTDSFLRGQPQRRPELIVRIGKMKPGRQDTYDFVGLVVEKNLLARTRGSAPKRLLHRPSLITATCELPGRSSSGIKTRPSAAFTRSVGKNAAETSSPSIRTGSPVPVTLKLRLLYAAMFSKTVFWADQSEKFPGEGVLRLFW